MPRISLSPLELSTTINGNQLNCDQFPISTRYEIHTNSKLIAAFKRPSIYAKFTFLCRQKFAGGKRRNQQHRPMVLWKPTDRHTENRINNIITSNYSVDACGGALIVGLDVNSGDAGGTRAGRYNETLHIELMVKSDQVNKCCFYQIWWTLSRNNIRSKVHQEQWTKKHHQVWIEDFTTQQRQTTALAIEHATDVTFMFDVLDKLNVIQSGGKWNAVEISMEISSKAWEKRSAKRIMWIRLTIFSERLVK